ASLTDAKIPLIHRSNSKDSSALIQQKLIEPVAGNMVPHDISNPDSIPECIITSSSQISNAPLKVSCSINAFTSSSFDSQNKSNIKVSSGNYLPVDSPLSASPHPSTSPPLSPTSFSSASSATALTTANSDESMDMPNSMNFDSENWNVFSSDIKNNSDPGKMNKTTTSPCLLNTTTDYSRHFPTLDESVNEEEDYLRPPTPPPRSASTLCSSGMPSVFFVSFPNHISLNSMTPSFDQPTGYLQTNFPYSSQPYPSPSSTPSTNLSLSSSLSRNHPSRAHVIQPNSRRAHRTQYYTQQIHTDLHSLPNTKGLKFNENNIDPACFMSPTDLFTTQQPRFIVTSQPNVQLKSTVLPNGVVCSTIDSANMWNTKNVIIWDDSNCFNSNTYESLQIFDSDVNKTSMTTVLPTTTKAYSTANLMNNFPRSASGGFIGPGESTDSSSVRTYGSYNNHNNNRSRPTPLRKTAQQIYVHPGHPAFSSFIGPFDWPSHLFKAEQDISTLMSWTKSNFSKRILVSSEPALKKQVAQLFKVIQSFMGDRK
ncbi:unnamed protein product, partial [Schistosoma turkestanicum]